MLGSGLSHVSQLVSTAWASASTFRGSDNARRAPTVHASVWLRKRTGAVNDPAELAKRSDDASRRSATGIQRSSSPDGKNAVSLADLIVLGGCAAVEQAAKKGGHEVSWSRSHQAARRRFAGADRCGLIRRARAEGGRVPQLPSEDRTADQPAELLVDRAQSAEPDSAPEMTVLVGGMRVLNANTGQSKPTRCLHRSSPETLSNDFFVNLLDMSTEWKATSEMCDRTSSRAGIATVGRAQVDRVTRVDLVFGSNSQLRAIAEVYACATTREQTSFVQRLRGRVEQGDEPRPLRPRLIQARRAFRSHRQNRRGVSIHLKRRVCFAPIPNALLTCPFRSQIRTSGGESSDLIRKRTVLATAIDERMRLNES